MPLEYDCETGVPLNETFVLLLQFPHEIENLQGF
jgi:hypothetical protein